MSSTQMGIYRNRDVVPKMLVEKRIGLEFFEARSAGYVEFETNISSTTCLKELPVSCFYQHFHRYAAIKLLKTSIFPLMPFCVDAIDFQNLANHRELGADLLNLTDLVNLF